MNIKINSVLLFSLSIYFIMSVRISPGDTPYWLFGLIFLGLLFYLILDIFKIPHSLYTKLKISLLWILIITIVGAAVGSEIIVRHKTAPIYNVHDILLQQESAIRFLLDGKNPYATKYFGTPLEAWHYSDTEVNPALYHFVMMPFYLLFALPFYFISNHTIGYFDGRIPLLLLFFTMLLIASKVVKDSDKKQTFLILLTFNPLMLSYMLEGRSDIFMFSFLFLGFYLLQAKKYLLAGIPIALAFAVKQSAWPFFPFYMIYLFLKTKNIFKTIKLLGSFILVFIMIVLPFFYWDSKAFIDSTINYLSGSTLHSYPVSGYGFGRVLNEMGFIKNLKDYYPFYIWQLLIGFPILIILLRYLKSSLSINRMILVYGIFLFIYWYFSRYFHNSHLGYLSMVFITAYFWPEDKI